MNLPDNLPLWIAYINDELDENQTSKLDQAIENDFDLSLQIEGLRLLQADCEPNKSLIEFIEEKKKKL